MTGRFSCCCCDNIGFYGSLEDALSLCHNQGSRFYTAKSGNITDETLLGPFKVEPPELIWTEKGSRLQFHMNFRITLAHKRLLMPFADIKLVNGSRFQAVDCNDNIISIDPAAYAPQFIFSVFNFMYPGIVFGTFESFTVILDNVVSDYLGNLYQKSDKQKYFCFCKDAKR